MNVNDLLEILRGLPGEDLVVLAKDGEGNSYSPLSDYGIGVYVADSTWDGDYYDADDEDKPEDGVPAVTLWPTN